MHEGKNAVGASALKTVLLLAHQDERKAVCEGLGASHSVWGVAFWG